MPPLLPEYLSQPVQVVVQSVPPTEWWPVWVAAGATLVGSFGGALVGGRVAYKSAVKANDALLRRQKLEEALMVVSDIEEKLSPIMGSISADASGLTDGGRKRIKESSKMLNFSLTLKLRTLLKIYKPDLADTANALHIRLVLVQSRARNIESLDDHSLEGALVNPGMEFGSILNDIRGSLIKHLR